MSPRTLARLVAAWLALTLLACAMVHQRARITARPMPDAAASRWALDAMRAACATRPIDPPPPSARAYVAPGVVLVDTWKRGRRVHRSVHRGALDAVVFAAARALPEEPCEDATRFTLEVVMAEGSLVARVPYLSAFALVPLHDGLSATIDGRTAWVTPSEFLASGAYDRGIPTPLPELVLGVDLDALVTSLARALGVTADVLRARGSITRWRIGEIAEGGTSREVSVTEATLRAHARRGARFLTRHQRADGRFVYLYDGRTNRDASGDYDLARHGGAAMFLALVGTLDHDAEARRGARDALAWLSARSVSCGAPERRCVANGGRYADLGATALAVSAAAEHLAGGDDEGIRRLLAGYTAFLRAQQRPDGEFMHRFDFETGRPVDVQFLYYSGEAALALLRAHAVLGDPRDLAAARRALAHLSGRAWNFFGSRYYYGEEHWTCIAAGEARAVAPSREALDFCLRWAAWNRAIQYGRGETPWASSGTYGVGPVLVPMLTPTGSRTEAFIETWSLAHALGVEAPGLRAQIELGLGALLGHQWTPGPTHLFADPEAAEGGFPMGAASLTGRNDYVQHAGTAMIRWADVLRREREGRL
jgi:hypothetical protein